MKIRESYKRQLLKEEVESSIWLPKEPDTSSNPRVRDNSVKCIHVSVVVVVKNLKPCQSKLS